MRNFRIRSSQAGSILPIALMAFAIVAFLVLVNFAVTPRTGTNTTNESQNVNVTVTTNENQNVSVNANGNTNAAVNVNVAVNTNTTVDATEGWKTYTNTKWGFSFRYPQDLKVTSESDYSTGILVIVSDKKDLPGGGSTTSEEYNVRVNADGYGPQFPYKTWSVEKTEANGFRVVNEKQESGISPNPTRIELVATEASAVDGKGFRMNFYNESAVDKMQWEEKLKNVLSSFTFTDPTAGWKTYSNSTYGYSFKYPPDWQLTEFHYKVNDPTTGDTTMVTDPRDQAHSFLACPDSRGNDCTPFQDGQWTDELVQVTVSGQAASEIRYTYSGTAPCATCRPVKIIRFTTLPRNWLSSDFNRGRDLTLHSDLAGSYGAVDQIMATLRVNQ